MMKLSYPKSAKDKAAKERAMHFKKIYGDLTIASMIIYLYDKLHFNH